MSASLVEDLIPPTKSLHSLLHDFLTWNLQNCGEEKLSLFCKLQNYKNFHDNDFELSTRSPFCLSTILLPCSTLFTMSFFVLRQIFSESETFVNQLNDRYLKWGIQWHITIYDDISPWWKYPESIGFSSKSLNLTSWQNSWLCPSCTCCQAHFSFLFVMGLYFELYWQVVRLGLNHLESSKRMQRALI